jgi:general secretion pathway protein K
MKKSREGSALLFALVMLVILSSLMVSYLFRINLEIDLATRYRSRMKAQGLAEAGQEYAKLMILKSPRAGNEPEDEYSEGYFVALKNLQRGVAVQGFEMEMGDGKFTLHLLPETGRRNINRLAEVDWEAMLESTGVPEDLHDELIANFMDWTDADEANRLKGAESDDDFYQDAGYPVKNGPVDSLDEMLLIKGFTRAIVYGGPLTELYEQPDVRVAGIANLLTVYGDGKISINSANRDVLATISGLDEEQINDLLEKRSGLDEIFGTEDDGFQSVGQALNAARIPGDAANAFSVGNTSYIRAVSIGDVGGIRSAIWATYETSGRNLTLLSFREEELP